MSRYAIAAIAAAVTFPLVWFVVRVFMVLISNAIGKSQEDFPPPASGAGPWPVLIAALSATAVAYIIMRRR